MLTLAPMVLIRQPLRRGLQDWILQSAAIYGASHL